ncbi:MAG: hypothetical protein U9Q20_06200 [Campylobacterota bacterium]|nr:hypothetical protein [Campylobacterota bacterium]
MSSIIVIKFADISFRLHLVNKLDNNEDISSLIPVDIKMTNIFRYLNVFIYPITFILALI